MEPDFTSPALIDPLLHAARSGFGFVGLVESLLHPRAMTPSAKTTICFFMLPREIGEAAGHLPAAERQVRTLLRRRALPNPVTLHIAHVTFPDSRSVVR